MTSSDSVQKDRQTLDPGGRVPEPTIRSLLAGVTTSAAAMFALAFVGAVAALFAFWLLARPIALLLAGIIIAQALMPIVDWLARWVSRSIAIAVVYVSLLGVFGFLGWLIVPALVEQGQNLVDRAPEIYEDAVGWLTQYEFLNERLTSDAIEQQVTDQIGQFGSLLVNLPLTIVSTVLEIVFVLIMSIYWLVTGPALRAFTLSLFPTERHAHVDAVLTEMGQTMGGYLRGIALDTTVLATLAFTGLSLIGVQYALVLALMVALLNIIPIVGPIIAAVPIVAVALLDSLTTAIIALVFWTAVQQFENYVTLPFFIRRQADIPPLLVLLAILGGGSAGGILGALLAIPLVGALRVFVLRVVVPAIRKWTGADDLPDSQPPPPAQTSAQEQ